MIQNPLRTGPWFLTDLNSVKKIGKSVLSTFSCGGGSTMGYKLAGYDVIGCVEIDPKMMKIYRDNHNPKFPYLMGVQDFNKIPNSELPKEFFELDILDGSPPCSTFSMAGKREAKWGGEFHFAEGQVKQRLDDLFFNFIETVDKLKPKVVVAENVKGLIQGNAKGYVKQIFQGFKDIGYQCQLFLLNAATMGVPQQRQRVFFIANRIGKTISLNFSEKPILLSKAIEGCSKLGAKSLSPYMLDMWKRCKPGQNFSNLIGQSKLFGCIKLHPNKPSPTVITSSGGGFFHWQEPRKLSDHEYIRLQTFPEDYKADNIQYVCGMSVPPFMMQRIVTEVYKQLLV
jgi:DNA (cytosine-5)-methyltransferase 1